MRKYKQNLAKNDFISKNTVDKTFFKLYRELVLTEGGLYGF